jgi:hypothetical protein
MPISGHSSTAHALQQQVTNRHLHSLLLTAWQRHKGKPNQRMMPQLQEQLQLHQWMACVPGLRR